MALCGFAAVGCFAAGCSKDTPTSPTEPVATTTVVFTGTLGVGETKLHAFTTVASGNAQATLASLTSADGQVLITPVTLSFGQLADGVCTVTSSVSARPSLVSQLTTTVSPGTYCLSVADPGGSGSTVSYAVRVVHP
jgi:hypothetical protein